MIIENIFTEFMALYYKESGSKPSSLKDISIASGVIARYTDLGCTIYYLTTGNYIRIPWEILDLFFSLNTYSGDRIMKTKPDNNLERLIQLFTRFVNCIGNEKGDLLITTLSDILDIGLKVLRDWYKNKFNKTLGQIEFFGPNKHLEL